MKRLGLVLSILVAAGLPRGAEAADDFGRLFFSAEERGRIDRPPPTAPTQTAPLPTVRVDGIVRSSRGAGTIWINGAPAPAGQARPAASGDAAQVTGAEGASVTLRVGETYRPETGARESSLPRVEVHRPAPAR